ncbi:para-nitrobenzyl esterase [Motilibacter peucedani]|uniref:Carboxylic ester hydrolase n=1 Tax=Motilibacter peucedani TaxID=598650 RepID=A0A420XQB2_9ACTN|nr:carboxylesterase family protein [Motilibacter peucedani]RKS75481.1 para-nitrobenzyl esterase [Motilibacter peucedani]
MRIPRSLRVLVGLAAAAPLLATGLLPATAQAATSAARAVPASTVVRSASGAVRGVDTGRFQEFLGLPYAAPPVRDLRFAPPAAAASWSGVRDASRQSPACLQFQPTGVREEQAVSEDCLYLDVYRPRTLVRGARLPVMVWFHGGGNTQGTGVIYGGGSMATKTGTIIISINYRLGALGFLAHPALSAVTPGGSGNYALMDQIASLRWVQRNIRAFGGDPGNVTIYGQSAGASAVCSMLAAPSAKGLFDKAVVESSSCMTPRATLAAGEASGVTFADAVGCTDPATVVNCLRKAWPGTLVANQNNYLGGPKVGGALLPTSPKDAITSGAWNKVPVMTGSTRSENRLLSTALAGITAQGVVDLVSKTYGAKAPAVLQLYPLSSYKTPYDQITQIQTDAGNACNVELNARAMTGQVPTYRYEFDDPTSPTLYGFAIPGEDMSNGHSAELQYLFDFTLGEKPLTATQEKLSDQMMRYWGTFARTGNPNSRGAPTWPQYGTNGIVEQLRTGGASHVVYDFVTEHHCDFWLS